MEKELLGFLARLQKLGMKGINGEVREALENLADCVQKTEGEARAKMHACVDENNLDPIFELSKLGGSAKSLSEEIRKLTKLNADELEALLRGEEGKEDEPKETKEASLPPKQMEEPIATMNLVTASSNNDTTVGKLTVSMISRTPVGLEINKTKHTLEEKNYKGLLNTLLRVQSGRDATSVRNWMTEWKKKGKDTVSFSNTEIPDSVYLKELRTYVSVSGSDSAIVTAIVDLIESCRLQDIYYVHFLPIK